MFISSRRKNEMECRTRSLEYAIGAMLNGATKEEVIAMLDPHGRASSHEWPYTGWLVNVIKNYRKER